jgi:hypothetical protein
LSTVKPCVRHLPVRRHAVDRHAGQQRALEPAAVLVGALQVQVGRLAEPRARQHASWVTPESNQTSRMSVTFS